MEKKYDILKTEFLLCQGQMDKYDQLASTVKAWTVTLWAASVGWFMQTKIKGILLLSISIAVVFWVLDSMNKNFREDYKERRDKIAKVLAEFFNSGTVANNIVAPHLPSHEHTNFVKKLFRPHIFPLYLVLILIAVLFLSL